MVPRFLFSILNSRKLYFSEAVAQSCSVKKVFFESPQNSQENTCEACTFLKREALAQVFSCEFCEISKNTFFIEHLCWLLLHFGHYFASSQNCCKYGFKTILHQPMLPFYTP